MKAVVRILLSLVVVSTGLAWAAGGENAEDLLSSAQQIEQPQEVQPTVDSDEELTVEDLESMDPDAVEVLNCCAVDCWTEFKQCTNGCSTQACFDECVDERDHCIAIC